MKKQMIVLVMFALSLSGCKEQPSSIAEIKDESTNKEKAPLNLPKTEAGEIVKKTIEYAGGWEQWRKMKTLSFVKGITNYDSLGNKQRSLKQWHQYQLQPQFKAKISWDEDGDHYEMINNGGKAQKLKNGIIMTNEVDINSAWNSTFGSHYVVSMPFKLADPETLLEYQGLDTLSTDQIVHSIKVTYTKRAGSSGGLHTWWYYFDEKTYAPVANFLDYGNGFSYTQYESFQNVDGIKLHNHRKSYQSNSDRDLIFMGTDYTNTDIKFNAVFDKNLFDLKDE